MAGRVGPNGTTVVAQWRQPVNLRNRKGMSLLEVLLASVILATALIPILYSTHTITRTYERSEQISHAALLSQAIVDRIRYRMLTEDLRFWRLSDTPSEILSKLQTGASASVFERFDEKEASVVSVEVLPQVSAPISSYFRNFHEWPQGPDQPPDLAITEATNPALLRDLRDCRVTVTVHPSSTSSPIDSDLDDNAEWDMADVEVIVEFPSASGPGLATYWTTLSRRQHTSYQLPGGVSHFSTLPPGP